MTNPNIDDCINETYPWSGKPVQPDSLALYGDDVVGFCNPGCRDNLKARSGILKGKVSCQYPGGR